MKTIILRLLQVVLLAVLVIIGVNVLEPLRSVKLSEEKQAAAEETVREIKQTSARSRETQPWKTDRKIRRLWKIRSASPASMTTRRPWFFVCE